MPLKNLAASLIKSLHFPVLVYILWVSMAVLIDPLLADTSKIDAQPQPFQGKPSESSSPPVKKEPAKPPVEKQSVHWAFQSPSAIAPPAIEQTLWPRGSIDTFILAQLESQDLQPVPDANRATLVRRLYFDLIGLPPTPNQLKEVVDDVSTDALAKLVDRLLASSHFGERWARYWLDVVRFAESSGKEFNFTYPHAWPFRDYVINAFNHDKPFNQFVSEQIAGDLLPETADESARDREDRLIAPSMLAFGPKRHNSSGKDFRMGIVDDQIDVTCQAILGLTVACAKCHDHKFDPIPIEDYYALAGIFLSTEPLYGTIQQKYSNNPTDLLPIGPDGAPLHAIATAHDEKIAAAEKPLNAKQEELKKAEEAVKTATQQITEAEKLLTQSGLATEPPTQQIKDSNETDSNEANQEDLEAEAEVKTPRQLLDTATEELAAAENRVKQFTEELLPLKTIVEELKKTAPPRPPYAMSARDRDKPADTKVAIRGDFRKLGDTVPRGFLSALEVTDTPSIDPEHSGRLELAQWLTSKHNPLTARVFVNRIWHHLFGRGLVETVDNFGMMGKKPSHPDLLDSLAVQFMGDGWSIKRMIRTIVLSRTYQLSCQVHTANLKRDPGNKLLWRSTPRRLSVEAIRDAILTISGQLDLTPPRSSSVTLLGDQMVRGVALEKLQPTNHHRSIYLPVVRDYLPDLFDRFDFPSPSLVSGRRMATNVPSQALYLRNSTFVAEQALHAAKRLLTHKINDEAQIDQAMRWVFSRKATDIEREATLALILPIQKAAPAIENGETIAWASLFRALFATAEFRYLVDIESPDDSTSISTQITAFDSVLSHEKNP
ncbi:MAG TPA: DUF1553 domain-containing protein [Verrucomicrobiales bacterium]|nr:DUF1553 domain-containing protein [Verrucomicrobiales bacterium]